MKHLIALCLILVGIIHLLPLSGALGGERLTCPNKLPIYWTDPCLPLAVRHSHT